MSCPSGHFPEYRRSITVCGVPALCWCMLLALMTTGCTAIAMRPKTAVRTIFNINPAASGLDQPDFRAKMDEETGTQLRSGNDVRLLTNGEQAFPAMLKAIADAQTRISVQTYILRPDDVGNAVVDALCAAARRGVEVRFVGDAFGCQKMTDADFAKFVSAGVAYRLFNPMLHWTVTRINNRNHRKILVVDGTVAFLGGLNFATEYDGDGFTHWRDTAMSLRGPAAHDAEMVFAESWNQAGTDFIGKDMPVVGLSPVKNALEYPILHVIDYQPFRPSATPMPDTGGVPVRIVSSSPDETGSRMLSMYVLAINSARERVWITNGYFVPPVLLSRALVHAAQRGVDVRLLFQGETDEPTVRAISVGFYGNLLESNVKIYEWNHPILHAKTMLCDRDFATVGSANLDGRALFLNYEANAVVRDCTFVDALAEQFGRDCRSSVTVTLDVWRERSLKQKTREWLLLPLEGQF